MILSAVFERFIEESPVSVMTRVVLENALTPTAVDALFEGVAERQYTRDLLFSDVVDLMAVVVCKIRPSINAAYKMHARALGVTRKAVYNKINGLEPPIGAAPVRHNAGALAQEYGIRVRLAYYPPYHSKSNPIERCWGVLEMHWNGSLPDSIEAVLGFARTMTWKGKHPEVFLIETSYPKGVRVGPKETEELESQVVRLPSLERWFVEIPSGSVGDGPIPKKW